MFSYYKTISYNSLANNNSDATSFSTLPFKKLFLLFLYWWWLDNNFNDKQKKKFHHHSLRSLPHCFPYNMYKIIVICSNPETIPYTVKSFIVHIKFVFIWKFYLFETSYVKSWITIIDSTYKLIVEIVIYIPT